LILNFENMHTTPKFPLALWSCALVDSIIAASYSLLQVSE
jgi:hypothetical protein